MSTHGSMKRQMTLLDFNWEKHLDEYNGKFHPGWDLSITLAWWILDIERWGNWRGWSRLKHWDWRFQYPFQFLGFRLGLRKSDETPEMYLSGDATKYQVADWNYRKKRGNKK